MRSRAVGLVTAIAATGALVAGCGGGKPSDHPDGGSGSAHVQTSGDTDEPLGTLSPSELPQVCVDGTPAFGATRCTALGVVAATYAGCDAPLTDAELKDACLSAADDCASHAGAAGPDCAGADSPLSPSCIATVGDYVACVNATVDA